MQHKTLHRRKRKCFLLVLLLIAVGMTKAQAQVSTWDGSWEPWTNGNGTENDPFLIENAQQLAYLAYQVNNGLDANNEYVVGYGKYYRLMTDIDLNGNESFQWTPIGLNSYSFGGCFDGNNHIISGVYINLSYANRVGFFGYTNGATILDLIISGNKISTTGLNAGGIIGIAGGLTVVSGCGNNVEYVSSDKASYVNTCSGGIVGQAEDSVSIINCYNSGSIYSHSYSSSYSGGIVGQAGNMVSVINCYNMGGVDSFSVSSYSGGIVGQVEGTSTLTNNYNIAAVSSFADSNSYSGGIIGKTEGTFSVSITNCFNTGSVSSTYNSYYSSGSSCSGGIVGQVESSVVTNSYNTGSLSSSGGTTNIGGIFGVMSNGSVDNSYYLDSCGGTNTYGGEPQTEVFMKSSEFVTILNDGSLAYQMDNQPFVNQGYPIFSGFFMHTLPVSVVTCYSATLNGDYVSGIYNIDTQGFEYKKAIDQEYTTVNCTAGQTPYSYVLNDLESGTTYQYRAFVTTDEGTAYGNLIEFTTLFLFDITAEANPTEGGIVIGAGDYQPGGTCTLTATANEGYSFINWTENGTIVSLDASYSFVVTGDRTLVANFVEGNVCTITFNLYDSFGDGWNGNKLVVTDGNGTSQQLTISSGSSATFSLQFIDGSHVTLGWISGSYIGECSFTVCYSNSNVIYYGSNLNSSFSYEFDVDCEGMPAILFDITAVANPEESGITTGTGEYQLGDTCTLTATANEGYTFMYWTKNGEQVSSNAIYSFTVTENSSLVAHFTLPLSITATANPEEGGLVNGGGIYDYHSSCTLTATANEGYTFMNWTENGNVISTYTTYTFTVTTERELVANFSLPLNITASVFPEEGGTVTGAGVYNYNENCTLSAVANSDYYFVNWTKDDTVVSTQPNYSFIVTEEGNYVAHFVPKPVGIVTAMYDPEPENNQCPYVRVCWDSEPNFQENFERGDFSLFDWQLDSNHPWVITTNNPYEGNYCMKSGGAGVASVVSDMSVTITIPEDGIMSFYSKISCESYDGGRFYIDNIQKGSWSGNGNWGQHNYDITAGQHTFKWSYRKDGSVNSYDDCFYVDNISFISSTRGENRAANYYKVYRGESIETGMPALVADHVTDTCYLDTVWSTLEEGWYRYGVKACYSENDTTSLNESNMVWSNQILRAGVHAIAVIVDPLEGGTITGAGEYVFGADCILTATPVENWTFLNWSENGEVVSTDSTYTFTVTTDRELLANFMPPLTITASAYPSGSGIITGDGVIGYGQTCTLTAIPNEGYSFCSWIENDSVVAYSPTYSFTVTGDRSLVANFGDCPDVVIGDGGTSTNTYLPSYSYFKYSLTQQIYTADEIGRNGLITSIALYNGGATKTRDYDIYMVNTDKTSFGSTTDWIAITADDIVYSGSVTMEADTWTTIIFDTPFTYDGISNLALIVDDNSGNWSSSPHMACRVFDANGNQAIRIYSDNTNYDPNNPTQYSGTRLTVKNQIILGFSISNTIETNITDEICQGDDYLQNGFEIYYPEVGESQYSITLPSSQNLDSIVNLLLTVHPVYFFAEDTTLCNATSYTWRGNTYTESGIYYDSLQTVHGCDSIFQLSLELFNTPLGEFASMTPTNNYPFTSLPITFSWDAVSGAEYYNLYLWNTDDPVPSTPFAGNIYNRSCYVSSLQNHQTYNWYVEAVNTCFTSTSGVRSFSLNIPPSMNVSTNSLSFGEVVLNDSVSMNMFVSGNALDDAITLQITGEDASMFSFEQGSNWNGLTGGSLTVTFSPTAVQYNYTANLVITTGTLTQTVQLTGSLADMFVFNTYVTQDVFEMNSTIPIYGTVTDVNNNPMAGADVEVKVRVMGTTRSLFATTGDDGHFSVDFVPAYSESGYYTVNSGRVGHNSTAVHDDFNIPGMNLVTNGWILWDVVQNETTTGSIVIRNRSQIPLTNIQVTATNLPEGCAFTFQPLSLQGMEEGVLEYSVTGSALTSGNNYEEMRLVATSAEGATMNFSAWYYCAEPRGILYASPNAINTTMTKGISKIVDVMLYNNGTGPTGSVSIDLPSEEWLSVVGNDTLASIAVHDSAYFSLRLSANANTPLVQYTGTIAVNCERGDGLLLPFVITAVSDSTGTLVVDVTDDYTYNGNGEHLAGATVTVKGYYSLETVALGLTGSDGTFTVEDIPEGYYRMSITAPHHAEYQATILIEGGQTNTQNIYLQYQAITYSWNVVSTEIQDEYTFELIVEYETNVPVPVVVIDMPQTFPELEEGESYVFNYIITNYGLVDTYDATLYPPTGHPLYDFSALVTEIDTLHAQSTMVIPCTMTKRARQRSQAVLEALGEVLNREDECPDRAMTKVQGYYYCGAEKKYYTGYCMRIVGSHPCETPPSHEENHEGNPPGHSGGGGGGEVYHYSGSGGSSTPATTVQNDNCNVDPCQTNAMDELNSCPPQSDNTPKLPPVQPGNNR